MRKKIELIGENGKYDIFLVNFKGHIPIYRIYPHHKAIDGYWVIHKEDGASPSINEIIGIAKEDKIDEKAYGLAKQILEDMNRGFCGELIIMDKTSRGENDLEQLAKTQAESSA